MDKHIKHTNKTNRGIMKDFSLGSDMCSWMLSNCKTSKDILGSRYCARNSKTREGTKLSWSENNKAGISQLLGILYITGSV